MSDTRTHVRREINHWIAQAEVEDISLAPSDFTIIGTDVYIDSMDPAEWLDAMTGE